MTQKIILSGVNGVFLRDTLGRSLIDGRPRIVGIAAAFVSMEGFRQMEKILRRSGGPACRLVAGTDNAVTHPEALYAARDHGWQLRLGKQPGGIFHPKLVVAGRSLSRGGIIEQLCSVYVGSSNLTNGGLGANLECGLIAVAGGCLSSASDVFAELWRTATPASDGELRHYAARFAECARARTVADLTDLGVSDGQVAPPMLTELRMQRPPVSPALGADFAVAAWAGLQSFTGEYRFQVEFPGSAGKVISQLVRAHVKADGRIDVYCQENGSTYSMQYRYYKDNGMFRLNIPNDVPGVEWARKHRDGLALVERGPRGGAPLRVRILMSGTEVREVAGRSAALGTWGKTTTRAYGWY